MLRRRRAVSARSRQVQAFLQQRKQRARWKSHVRVQSARSTVCRGFLRRRSPTLLIHIDVQGKSGGTSALRMRALRNARQGCGAVELRSLGRLGQDNLTRLPRPVTSWSATALAWTSALFGRTLSVSHHPPSLGRLLPAGGQVARRLPGHQSSVAASPLRCWTGLLEGRSTSGGPFPRKHVQDTLADCWGLQRRPGQCFAPQLTNPESSWDRQTASWCRGEAHAGHG